MMRYVISTIVVLLFGLCNAADPCKSSPCINVDIYYETLCPYSIEFITDQLVPSYPALKNYLNINFITYGIATYTVDESNNYVFECDHGPSEFQGNKAQVCASEAILNLNTTFEIEQSLSVGIIGCAMSSRNIATAVPQCAEKVGLSADTRKHITDCIESDEGADLLAAYGDITDDLEPALTTLGVPTIVLDYVYSEEDDDAARSNFKKLICGRIPAKDRPRICAKKKKVRKS